jgi:EthD domain
VEIVVRDVADFAKARQDPFYKEYVIPDEEKMCDRGDVTWTVGWEELKTDVQGVDKDLADEINGNNPKVQA